MPRACIFCNSPLTSVRAKEHVIPQWLMEYLGITDDQLYLAAVQSVPKADFQQIQRNRWYHLTNKAPNRTNPPDGTYKINRRRPG
jgi:hypothetical protein